MAFTVASLRISSMDLQLSSLALLILDLHKLIISSDGLGPRIATNFTRRERDHVRSFLSSANITLDEVKVIRDADLTLQLWDTGHSRDLVMEIYILEKKAEAIVKNFERWLREWWGP
ncbi:hypothetical protein Q9L58_005853 [Maublancomyces gigas]|uniref:Uncharacterized protein n=1 Tax=Discina gigas TaxID=1032678 RepID=A0ABR3GH07_9PEZI